MTAPGLRGCVAVLILALPGAVAAVREAPDRGKPLFTVLYTAEAHAALLPCDCPLQPLGGVARRATLINQYRQRGPVLLLDGGGWAPGGLYDEDSDGEPARDNLRRQLMAQAMRIMNYDFISARVSDATGLPYRPHGTSFRHRMPSGDLFTVEQRPAGEEELLFMNENWAPLPARPLSRAPDIIISRMGEEESTKLGESVAAETLIINAGRKSSQRVVWRAGNATLVNFDYQAQRLGIAEVYAADPTTGRMFDIRVRLDPITASIAEDKQIADLLAPHMELLKKKGKKTIAIEFWTMPQCPGCAQIRPDIQRITADAAGRATLSLHFVLHKANGKLGSLHGERELDEAGMQAVIQKYYPEKLWAWIAWRDKNPDALWQDGAKALGLLAARLRGAVSSGEALKLLEDDYELSLRRRISATPSLVIGNRVFDPREPLDRPHILRVLCGLLDSPKPAACADVPACFHDAQCRKRGFIGRCLDAGKPSARCDTERVAVKVPVAVITDRDNLYDNHERIMEILIEDLPGIEFRVLDIADPEAKDLLERAQIKRVPAYFLDPIARTEVGYAERLGKAVKEDKATGRLVLTGAAVTGAHRILGRERKKARVDVFVSRFSKAGQEAIETALEHLRAVAPFTPELVLHDALFWEKPDAASPNLKLAAIGGLAEVEEAARALAVKKLAPDKHHAYLLERGKLRGGSYWDVPLKKLGIDPAQVRELAERPAGEILKAMQAEADLLKELDAGGAIVLLAENCEVIPVQSPRDLLDVLQRIGPSKK